MQILCETQPLEQDAEKGFWSVRVSKFASRTRHTAQDVSAIGS
jgi:hypothetical protein